MSEDRQFIKVECVGDEQDRSLIGVGEPRRRWPTRFTVRPQVGDYVESQCGDYEGLIERVTHVSTGGRKTQCTPMEEIQVLRVHLTAIRKRRN